MKYLIISVCFIVMAFSCATGFGVYHTVKKDETVRSVSELYKIDTKVLRTENQIPEDINELDEGTTIFIPGAKKVLEPAQPVKTAEPVATVEVPVEDQKVTIEPEKTAEVQSSEISFKWPLKGAIISRFGGELEKKNEGIDIETAEGAEVRASAEGKAIYSAGHHGFGNMVIIQHNEKYITIYAHLSEITVKEGQTILAGELIGLSGKTGAAPTPRLHFEIREYSKPVDPEKHLKN